MSKEKAYIARCKCGGIVMACAASHPEDAAKEVASCIKAGFSVERMDDEGVRTGRWCDNRGNCKSGEVALFSGE